MKDLTNNKPVSTLKNKRAATKGIKKMAEKVNARKSIVESI